MRTTLDLDDDVLQAARELADRLGKTMGQVVSDLARNSLNATPAQVNEPAAIYGFRPFPKTGRIVTNAMIDKLREDDVY